MVDKMTPNLDMKSSACPSRWVQSNMVTRNGYIVNNWIIVNSFCWLICRFTSYINSNLTIVNNFVMTNKILTPKFDCSKKKKDLKKIFEYSRFFSWPQHTLSFNYMVIYAKIWEQGQVWKEPSGHPCFNTLLMAQKYTQKKIHRTIFMSHHILTSTFFNDRSLAIPLHFCPFFSFKGKA